MFYIIINENKISLNHDMKIFLIKEFRNATDCGLKEAKDIIVDHIFDGNKMKERTKLGNEYWWIKCFKENLKEKGFIVQEIIPEELFYID